MTKNITKEKLKAGETVFGCFVRYADAGLVEFLGYQGWDFFVFDGEHGAIDPHHCEHMIRAAELRGVSPMVRVTTNSPPVILRYMDTGAQGAVVSWVNSAEAAKAAVESIKYYPIGQRGLAGVRAAGYGQAEPLGEYVKRSNAETLVAVQVETANAVEQVSAIANVNDIDVVFIGPTDLSHSLGVPGDLQHPRVQKALDRVVDAVADSSCALGIYVGNVEAAKRWQQRGARYIAIGLEGLLASACRDFLGAVRA